MPSREGIAETLRDGAHVLYAQRDAASEQGAKDLHKLAARLDVSAAQVEAMRCETCKHYDKQHQLCEVVGGSELLIPACFGCFAHEPK